MSSNYRPHDLLFVSNVGYATLIHCGRSEYLTFKSLPNSIKTQPSIFNFNMFEENSQPVNLPVQFQSAGDANQQQPSKQEAKEEVERKHERNLQIEERNRGENEQQAIRQTPNIVTLQLQGTSITVHTPESKVRNHVFIPVKVLLPNFQERLTVQIQINQTLQSLIKVIFSQIGLKLSSYYAIKLISTSPLLQQYVNHAETIAKCKLSESSQLILTGKHAFCFEDIALKYSQQFFVSQNNTVVAALQNFKSQESEEKKENSVNWKNFCKLTCDTVLSSGKHYWEFIIKTMPSTKDGLVVGLREEEGNLNWIFYPLALKLEIRSEEKCQIIEEEDLSYFQKGDRIGLLLSYNREKKGNLKFFRNGALIQYEFKEVGCGVRPFVGLLDGEMEISSKVEMPLDSYRYTKN